MATVLAPMGLRLSAEKTKVTHIDEGFDFLGLRIQRHRKRGTNKHYVYTYPSRKAIKAVALKVKAICRRNVNAATPTSPPSAGSTHRCGAGAPTSNQACPPSPSPDLGQLHPGPVPAMGAAQTPPGSHREHPSPLLQRRMVADHTGDRAVEPGQGAHHALPLPGNRHPHPWPATG